MKTFLIAFLFLIASKAGAGKYQKLLPDKPSAIFSTPTHRISLITKEGYRLDGLLMSSNDSQLIIFPGKYKAWKAKKNYMMVYYPYSKIETVKFFKARGLFHRKFSGKKKNIMPVNGSKHQFLALKQSLNKKKSRT